MRPMLIWPGLILSLMLGLGVCGLAVSQELPPEVPAAQTLLESAHAVANAQPSVPEGPAAEEPAPEPMTLHVCPIMKRTQR